MHSCVFWMQSLVLNDYRHTAQTACACNIYEEFDDIMSESLTDSYLPLSYYCSMHSAVSKLI